MITVIVYDDTVEKSEVIADIIGSRGFGEVVVKKKRLEEYYHDNLNRLYPENRWYKITSAFEYEDFLEKRIRPLSDNDVRILHCFSDFIFVDIQKALLTFEKLNFIDETFRIMADKKPAAIMFPSAESYISFCRGIAAGENAGAAALKITEATQIEGMVDIGDIGNFIQCITGNFDSRFFNSLKSDKYTLVKSSSNIEKIKAEYSFYHLLPENMKYWFVQPFDYKEENGRASYCMERLHMTDLAIKWVHGSMDMAEFDELLDKYFYFFKCRPSRECSRQEYESFSRTLYEEKVRLRIEQLREIPEYNKIEKLMQASGFSIDDLLKKYFTLKSKIEEKSNYPLVSVIGHGDPCFANALYNRTTRTLKFIDPKGALSESELWTNPYYDVAKLSHSICGNYDFFNNALFDIRVGEAFNLELEIGFDNSEYVERFKEKAAENGFDYNTVRIYEASLFLSMLPLHRDYPQKVLGFILNAKRILEEIEKNV